jgi:hypothetical protein
MANNSHEDFVTEGEKKEGKGDGGMGQDWGRAQGERITWYGSGDIGSFRLRQLIT